MVTTVKVKSDDIYTSKQKIDTLKNQYQQKYKEINGLVKAIYEAGNWAGSDAQKYNMQLQEFLNDFEDLERKLNDYVIYLDKAAKAYEATQGGTTRQASSLAKDRNG